MTYMRDEHYRELIAKSSFNPFSRLTTLTLNFTKAFKSWLRPFDSREPRTATAMHQLVHEAISDILK